MPLLLPHWSGEYLWAEDINGIKWNKNCIFARHGHYYSPNSVALKERTELILQCNWNKNILSCGQWRAIILTSRAHAKGRGKRGNLHWAPLNGPKIRNKMLKMKLLTGLSECRILPLLGPQISKFLGGECFWIPLHPFSKWRDQARE